MPLRRWATCSSPRSARWIRLQNEIAADENPHSCAWPDGDRRLNLKLSLNDPVAGAADRLTRTVTDRIGDRIIPARSEEHTSELQSLMRISYAVFCLKKKTKS